MGLAKQGQVESRMDQCAAFIWWQEQDYEIMEENSSVLHPRKICLVLEAPGVASRAEQSTAEQSSSTEWSRL